MPVDTGAAPPSPPLGLLAISTPPAAGRCSQSKQQLTWGTHEGEGAKISTTIVPGEIQKCHHPSVLQDIFLQRHVSHFTGFLLLYGLPIYPIIAQVLKRQCQFLVHFLIRSCKTLGGLLLQNSKNVGIAQITGGKIKLMDRILDFEFSHLFFLSKFVVPPTTCPTATTKMNKQVTSKH